jgi:uncharacterized membrane protein
MVIVILSCCGVTSRCRRLTVLRTHPRIKVPRSVAELIFEAVALAGLLAGLGLVVFYWPRLPERVPTHFNLAGEADAWGARVNVLILPGVTLGLYTLLTLISFFPHIWNFPVRITKENAARQYRLGRLMVACLKAELVWVMAILSWQTMDAAVSGGARLHPATLPVMLGVVGVTVLWYFVAAFSARGPRETPGDGTTGS